MAPELSLVGDDPLRLPPASQAAVAAIFLGAASIAATTMYPKHEGVRYRAYADPASPRAVESRKPAAQRRPGWSKLSGAPWTICYGHTKGVREGDNATPEQCVRWAAEDAREHGLDISRCVRVYVPADSAVSFVSFASNVGAADFCRSTLNAKLNAGDLAGACNQLPRWVYAQGIRLPGLVSRRADERALCLKGLSWWERIGQWSTL